MNQTTEEKTWEERSVGGRKGIEEIYCVSDLDEKGFISIIHLFIRRVCSSIKQLPLPDGCLSNSAIKSDFRLNVNYGR